ncbi:NAD(P)/FAD-dependent oxidoreductase [Rhodocaloribacter sp.]
MRITIIGAGVMGLSAARSLAGAGHAVTVLDRGAIPNPAAASVDAHRLIRFPYGRERGYARMVSEAYGAWERLWRDLGVSLYHPTGTLLLGREGHPWARDSVETLEAMGHAVRRLTPDEGARAFPHLTFTGKEDVFFLDTGGLLFADRIVARLAEYAASLGVRLLPGAEAASVDAEHARVRLTSGRTLEADLVVVAAGAWAGRLAPSLTGRMTPSRQVVCYVSAPPETRAWWRKAPLILDIDPSAGFYLVPPAAGTPMKVGDHRFSMRGHPDHERSVEPGETARILALARPRLKHFERYRLDRAATCFYAVAPGERFIVERTGRAWVLAGFSGHGFKFGPLFGERLASVVEGSADASEFTRWCAGLAV